MLHLNPRQKQILSTKLSVRYFSKNAKELRAIEDSLFLETKNKKGNCIVKVRTSDRGTNSYLEVEFSASEVVSLRASLNTNLRLVATAFRTLGLLEGQGQESGGKD